MPQMSFSAADFDVIAKTDATLPPLLDAALFLTENESYGVVWLDPDLVALSCAGVMADEIRIGEPITRSLLPLIGMEDAMLALKTQPPQTALRLVNVAVMSSAATAARRVNVMIFWATTRQRFLVLFGTIFMQGSPTADLDQEIRRRRLLEQDLAAKTLEYAHINEQLEEFAYVISHDLNAPLRALRYLSSDVQEAIQVSKNGGVLDLEHLQKKIGDITAQTQRMSQMLADLLDYARIGRMQNAVEPVATRAIVDDIVATLMPTTSLQLSVTGEWPEIDTVRAPLDLVLRNLAENAVKHHDRRAGSVTIGAERQPRHIAFTITDDGRGIAPEWQAAIFEPFRKIDDAHHPESSGIGLALVKKTVTTLGGTIEVHSNAPGVRGTIFTVLWPLRIAGDHGSAP